VTVTTPKRTNRRRDRLPSANLRPRLRDLIQRPAPMQRYRAFRMGDPWFAGIVAIWGIAVAGFAIGEQWQLLATIVWVPGFAMLFAQWPVIGTSLLFILWTFAPFLRRVLDVATPAFGPDILSLTPFMATLSVAYVAYRRYRPGWQINVTVGMVIMGFAVGIPLGFQAPFALFFGIFAYTAAVFGVYIGYANGRESRFTMEQLLIGLVLVASVYGVWQGLVARLPIWDQTWLIKSGVVSIGTKEGGNFRVFSVLNSPYTYASLVAVYLAVLFVSRKVSLIRIVTVVIALIGFFLTQSRGAWVSMVGGLVLITFFTGGRALPRLIGLVFVLGGMYFALGSTPAGTAVVQRASSVGAGTNDVSGKSRMDAITTLVPESMGQPLGHGIGSVGAAASLNPDPEVSLVDNGYLIVLYQVGPLGFLLIGFGILGMIVITLRHTTPEDRKSLLPLLAPIGVYVPLSFFSETLYGITGFILFYGIGEALGRRQYRPEAQSAIEAARELDTAGFVPPVVAAAPVKAEA
jgi:hypothetical protein